MTPHDIQLLAMAVAAVAAVIALITVLKMHPFIALLLTALGLGLAAGQTAPLVLKSIATGFGDISANVGIVLALGAMFGALLSHSRGAERIASALVGLGGASATPWAMAAVGMLLGLPVFFETGLVMMMPIIVAVAARLEGSTLRGSPFLLAGLPALAGLSVLHGLVPPHPGPVAAVSALGADMGMTLLYGLLIAVPTVIIAGPVFASWAARHATAHPAMLPVREQSSRTPGAAATLVTVLFPIALMVAKAIADFGPPSPLRAVLDFTGAPVVALLLATLLAMVTFGFALGQSRSEISTVMSASLTPIAAILLVIGGGGAFKQTLVDLGLGAAMAHASAAFHVTPLLLGWGTAVLIRLATGSATVATVTAAGLMAGVGAENPALLALAIGSGSLFFSHVNDAGFWLIKGYFGMTLPDMFKTWSLLETIISVCGLVLVLLVSLL